MDESKAMKDLNGRIQQLTKLILTSQTVDEVKGDDSRPASPVKVDFDMSPYQVRRLESSKVRYPNFPRSFNKNSWLRDYS